MRLLVTTTLARYLAQGRWLLLLGLAGLLPWGVLAQGLPKPTGPVILTVSGQITQRNSPQGAQFDAAMLDALPALELTTSAQWQSQPAKFSGPSLKAVLAAVGANGSSLRLRALDRFEATLPVDDTARYNPVIALRVNGQALKVRTLGPTLVMYPFDQYPELNTDVYYSRCVWQLAHIVVE